MTDSTMNTDDRKITDAPLALPKGGGAIQGIGETAQTNAFTGAASLSIPVVTTACRGRSLPLNLSYQSGSGNGIYGLGFDIGIGAVTRKTSKGQPRYTDADAMLSFDGGDLIKSLADDAVRTEGDYQVTRYLPRRQAGFDRIEFWENTTTGDTHWRVLDRESTARYYGRSPASRIANPDVPTHVYSWLLDTELTTHGDATVYEYRAENADNVPSTSYEQGRAQTTNRYPARILYGNGTPIYALTDIATAEWHFEVVFDYGEYVTDPIGNDPYTPPAGAKWLARPDAFSTYQAGFEIRTHRLCRTIMMFHRFTELGADPVLVHMTRLHYAQSPTLTLLTSAESIGCRLLPSGYEIDGFPPLEFDYTEFNPGVGRFEPMLGQFDGAIPGVDTPPDYRLIDLYGEGIPGILFQSGDTVRYADPLGPSDDVGDNGGPRYSQPVAPSEFPSLGLVNQALLMDVTGTGRLSVVGAGTAGIQYSQAGADRTWAPFRALSYVPSDLFRPDTENVDVTGDGLADLLFVDDIAVSAYPSARAEGYGPIMVRNRQTDLPTFTERSPTVAVRMADVFGSGRQHMVKITSGAVEVWPNLGYGVFGERIVLENAPAFGANFDSDRVFLVDIDGSGTADLVYVQPDGIDVYFNQSGNSFSARLTIPFPGVWDRLDQVTFGDAYGIGCAGVIFSEGLPLPAHWFNAFGNRIKPYLLKKVSNNMGSEHRFFYRSSTHDYLRDKQQGTPWLTHLPFPVQVVGRTETVDAVSGTLLVTTYSYRDGYYDPVERAFRGFGQVDRTDAESLETYLALNPQADQSWYTPPTRTRTWYHIGAWGPDTPSASDIADQFFQGDQQAPVLTPLMIAYLEADPNSETIRQAHGAVVGQPLREEVYGLDGSALEDRPYAVTDTVYQVRQDQVLADRRYAVFFTYTAETLSYHYERDAADPRTDHQVTLAVDDYGNPLKTCAVAYPRRPGAPGILPEQQILAMTCSTATYADVVSTDDNTLGLPVDSTDWQVLNPAPPASGNIYTYDEIATLIDGALAAPTTDLALLGRSLSYYWDPATSQPLPLGDVSVQGLACRTDSVFSDEAGLEAAFSGALSPTDLATLMQGDGGYVLDGGLWWKPGTLQQYQAAGAFYLAGNTVDPFGAVTQVFYDTYHLLVVRVVDAVGNDSAATGIDYQTVQPWQVRDPNENISEVSYDALGMLRATSFRGTELGGATGFAPLDPDQPTVPFDMTTALNDPQVYLNGAASYTHYDLFSWAGQVADATFTSLAVSDPGDIRRALVDAGYLSRCGAILGRFRRWPGR